MSLNLGLLVSFRPILVRARERQVVLTAEVQPGCRRTRRGLLGFGPIPIPPLCGNKVHQRMWTCSAKPGRWSTWMVVPSSVRTVP